MGTAGSVRSRPSGWLQGACRNVEEWRGRFPASDERTHGLDRMNSEVLQSEAAECGLACLATVARAHGAHIGLQDLRRRFPGSL
jgi:hypothetical protein